MTAMYQKYMDLLKEETLKSTQSMENWLKYIDGASRNFKYSFSEQLLINSQKPKATAIADYDTWSKKLGRTIKTKTAMYLPIEENGKLTVKNYFDAADTIARDDSPPLPQWGYSAEHEKAVLEHIISRFDLDEAIKDDTDLGYLLDSSYDKVSKKHLNANIEAINKALEGDGSVTGEADIDDKYEREEAFETALYASMALIVNKRLGIRPELNDMLISWIEPHLHLFNTEASINALGNAASSLSEEYLRSVEFAVKTYDKQLLKAQQEKEKQKNQKNQEERELHEQGVHSGSNGQDDLLRATDGAGTYGNDRADESGRHDTQQVGVQRDVVHNGADGRERPDINMPVSQHSDGRTVETAETLGHGTDGLLEGTQQVSGGADGDNRAAQALPGNRGTGTAAEEIHDGSHTQRPGEPSNRAGQSPRPDGMGGQDEQLPSQDSRDNQQGTDLRLSSGQEELEKSETPDTPETLSSKALIDLGAFSLQKIPPMFVVDWEEVKYDFDLNFYEDGDMVAYNKDGVSFKVSKMGEHNFITSTTSITPIGEILGDKDIPSYIRNEMRSYWNGDITAEQVREENLQWLEHYKNQEKQAINSIDESTETEKISQPEQHPSAEYPQSISHSPLLKSWYDALGQDEELTFALARGFNQMLSKGLTLTRKGQFEDEFEKMSAPILQQSKLTDAAYKVFEDKDIKIQLQHVLGYDSLGNGLTVWDRLNDNPETRDYETLAHIDFDRNITWYSDELPEDIMAQITETAELSDDSSFVSLGTHGERKKWLSMIDDMVSANGFITKEDFSYTPFDNHGGLANFINLYGIEGYERVLNRINKEALPQGLDNLHQLFKKQYPDRVIAVAAPAGFVEVRNIPTDTGLSTTVNEGYFSKRVSGKEYGDLLAGLREKGIAVVSVYPESGQIFTHNPNQDRAREVEPEIKDMIGEQQEQSSTTPPRSVVISSNSGFGSAPPSRENANSDVPGRYSNTFFRITGNGYNTDNWNEITGKAYQDEICEILTSNGWTIHEPSMSAASPTASKGRSHLYLHPQNVSGVCENSEREQLFEALQTAASFTCSTVDAYREIHDMSDEQLLKNLNNERETIAQELLTVYTTKRSNLYISASPNYSTIKRLAIDGKDGRHGIDRRTETICQDFVDGVRQSLLDSGRLVSSQTKGGIGYRAAIEKELKKLGLSIAEMDIQQPKEQDNQPQATGAATPGLDKNAQIKAVTEILGVDESLLREALEIAQTDERSIYSSRFNRLVDSVDMAKVKSYLERVNCPTYAEGDRVRLEGETYTIEAVTADKVNLRDIRSYEAVTLHRNKTTESFEQEYKVYSLLKDFVLGGKFEIAPEPPQTMTFQPEGKSIENQSQEIQEDEFFDWDKTVQEIAKETANYTEPFVVIEYMEGGPDRAFNRMDRLTFREADKKFKKVEAAHRADEKNKDNYDKTFGAVFYKENPDDTELSVYQFRYDVGDYDEERSGLYNHINNYCGYIEESKAALPDTYSYISDEDIAGTKKMLSVLADYVDVVPVYKPQIPNRTPQIGDEVYHMGVLHRLDGIDGIMINLFNLETNSQAAMITTKERFFEGLQEDERNRHLFFSNEQSVTKVIADPAQRITIDEQQSLEEINAETPEKAEQGITKQTPTASKIKSVVDVDKLYDYVKSKNLDNIGQNRLLREIRQKLNTARFIGGIRREPTVEEADDADLWLRERHPDLYRMLSDETSEQTQSQGSLSQATHTTPVATPSLEKFEQEFYRNPLNGANETPKIFSTLKAIESELDRKVALMADNPDYEKIKEAANYLKNWRTLSHRVGIAADALVKQINELGDVRAIDWFSNVAWDNWREALDIGDFEPLSVEIHREKTEQILAEEKVLPTKNFRMDSIDYASIAQGGAKSKFKRNIQAIRTLQAIEADGRKATPEEQEILAHYVGWGGIAEAFKANSTQWKEEYNELKDLLSPGEYEAARSSVLTAYYTEPTIMKAMWDKVEQLGGFNNYSDTLKSVNVLEPSAGVGNFFGVMPEHIGSNANIHGVELDSISGRIARLLYPDTKIQIKGFEKTVFKDDFFDVAIGNVPFSDAIKPVDWQYEKDNFPIHDYFFNKALDKVRPGGVVAFITTAYTLDKVNDRARLMMAEKAEMLGAIRLPNNAFKANAGTEVVSDIIFLQKREEPLNREKDLMPDWINSQVTREAGRNSNTGGWYREQRRSSYFIDNPHMVMGEYKEVSGPYGPVETVLPKPDATLSEQLQEAMSHIAGNIPMREIEEAEVEEETATKHIPYDYTRDGFYNSDGRYIDVKDSSFVLVNDGNGNDEVYFRNNYRLNLVEISATGLERIKGMVSLRNILRDLIQAQVDDRPDKEITHLQNELNTAYDNYTKKYGLITSSANEQVFDNDDSYYLLTSLEKLNNEFEFIGKSDIFTKRTIRPHVEITSVNTSVEAFGVSIGYKGKIDLDYMAQLTDFDKQRIINDLEGVIFLDTYVDSSDGDIYDISTVRYLPADEYLSGNVRKKLALAKELAKNDPRYEINVAALEKAQPVELEAHEIYVRLGTTWIDRKYIQQFMYEILETPNMYKGLFKDGDKPTKWTNEKRDEKDSITVQYSPMSNEWRITNKNAISGENIKSDIEYGTGRINAYHILEQTLNLKDVVIKDKMEGSDGKIIEVVNEEETVLARQKQEDLKNAFRDWIFKDPERREALVSIFNTKFNSTRPREYDGSHIVFAGMNAEIVLDKHQIDAVARGIYGGNTLLAHEVGAGKSFEMFAIAMEAKRIGQCTKSLITVPKHLTGQMASEFLRLYPNANILVATDKTFEPKNRKRFCAKVATGNYDAIIMGHTQFEMIPLSKENQEIYYREQFSMLVDAIAEARDADSGYFTVKQMENVKSKVAAKLEKLYKENRKDNVIDFEQLGIDKLFVDEADLFKNLHLYTKMRNVAGISQTEAQKSADMFMKCRYLDKETDSKGTVFATGTPISNSLTEMYTMQRYLQYEKLVEMGLEHFDQWASIFTEPTSDMELAPEGTGYRMRTRCAKFHNLPELMNMFFEVADIKTAESLNLPRPSANFHTISCEPTDIQKSMVQSLSKRADAVRKRRVKPHIDNMLAVTNDGRKLGLDQRVINPNLPDDPNSKINQATDNIFNIWEDTKEDRLTQVVFCDLSTPKKSVWALDKAQQKEVKGLPLLEKATYLGKHILNTAKNIFKGIHPNKFNIYDDVKAKLILKGIPEEEIAFVQDCKSDKQKQQLFAKVRAGTIRVIIGSTETMGAGTNIQDRLVALHHLDCPWRPRDLAQREGRILRRGNDNKVVNIYKYVTKDTFDAYLYQTIEKKQMFISQIMTEKSPMRTVDDIDQSVLDYAEIKALCVGNPKIKEKMDLEQDLKKLNAIQAQYKKNLYRMETALLKTYPAEIKAKERNIENYAADEQRLAKGTLRVSEGISPMVIDGITYDERSKAGEAIQAACRTVDTKEGVKIGTYRGFELHLSLDSNWSKDHILTVRGDMPYPLKLEGNFSTQGVVTRIDNMLEKIPEYIEDTKESLENTINQMKTAEIEVVKPFPQEVEIKEKTARVALLNIELNLDAQKLEKAGLDKDIDDGIDYFTVGIVDVEGEDLADDADDAEVDSVEVDSGLTTEFDVGADVSDSIDSIGQPAERPMDEIPTPSSASICALVTQEIQVDAEIITENFELAENGGQGAYVSGNVFLDKSTEKATDTFNVPYQQERTASGINNNIVNLFDNDAKQNTPNIANSQTQQQAEPKPVKPKRSYAER